MNTLSTGCFYTFELSVIINARNFGKTTIVLDGERYQNKPLKSMGELLKKKTNVVINKHGVLNSLFANKLQEVDFNDENRINELKDIYKSLLAEKRIITAKLDLKNPVELKAMYLALAGVNPSFLMDYNPLDLFG